MPTVTEIKEHYEGEKSNLLTETFDLAAKARQVDISMAATVKERLGPKDFNAVKAAEGEVWAEDERQRLKTKYVELDLEMRAAIEERAAEVERELSPKSVSADDLLSASKASPESLISMMDLALDAGLEDAALLAFAAGRQRDFDDVVAHAIDAREDWADLYSELAQAAQDPDLDPGDRFELFAQPAPQKQNLLGAPQRDINLYGQLG
jgi:hypothetical protein